MNHPILVAAVAEDRRRQYSCGAVTREPNDTCRGCRAAAVSRDETTRSCRHTASCWTPAGIAKARLSAWVTSLLHVTGKGAES
jgi:hypothetical protein